MELDLPLPAECWTRYRQSGAPRGYVRQELAHHIELVIARPQLLPPLATGLVVLPLDDLGVVLDDVGQPAAGERFLPQVVSLEPVGVWRIAAAAVPSPVEGQEPRFLPLEVSAEPHLVVVHGEVGQAASQLEELLAGIAVALVLLDRVFHRLLGEAVLQLEGGDRQAVDEQTQVQRQLRVVAAVLELAGDAEAVQPVEGPGLLVPRRRRAAEQVDPMRAVLDPVAQDVDGPALGDLPLQAGQELLPRRAVLAEGQQLGDVRLGRGEECGELDEVHAVLAVVVARVAAYPAHAVAGRPLARCAPLRRIAISARHRRADEALQPPLAGVGGHAVTRLSSECGLPAPHRALFLPTPRGQPPFAGLCGAIRCPSVRRWPRACLPCFAGAACSDR